ncbi:MAG TPA: ABC transporter permease [Phycisphaerales bacterium]|nr:ABC transporter permease [Phycisphaerales bacterium]
MTRFLIRRLVLAIPTLVGISFVVFMLVALSPGGVSGGAGFDSGGAGASVIAQRRAYLDERYGLSDPVLVQYARWLGRVSPVKFGERADEAGVTIVPRVVWVGAPDLGVAFSSGRRVSELIAEALPITLLLNVLAFPIVYAVAVPCGVVAAVRRGRVVDRVSRGVFVTLWSVPTIVAAVLLVGFLSGKYGWFPAGGLSSVGAERATFLPGTGSNGEFEMGWLLDRAWHLVLPVVCLVYGGFAVLSRQTRAAVLEQLGADYVRTARAKGVPEGRIVTRHVLRNSLLPIITMFAALFPATLAGSVVVEKVFSIPGMGTLLIGAIDLRDREVLLGVALMIGVVNVVALLVADVLYAMVDPRISYE